MSLRERIRFWFDDLTTPMGRITDLVIMGLIIVACANAVAMTYWDPEAYPVLAYVDVVITVCFVAEYALRLWVAEDRLRHVFSLYSLIDLVAIVPGVPFRGLRIFRLLRILRLIRFLETQEFFFGRIRQIHLYIARIAFTLFAIPFLAAGLIFYAEHRPGIEEQKFGNFFDAFYYSVVTLTTVGFGDLVPSNTLSRALTLVIILSGIVFIPWQVKNLIAHFISTREKLFRLCSSCGLEYHESDAHHCRRCGTKLTRAMPPAPDGRPPSQQGLIPPR